MPTLWSAVSLIACLAVQGSNLSSQEAQAASQIVKSVLTVYSANRPVGTAVVVDGKTMLVAHQNVASGPSITGRSFDGASFQLVILATDAPTQLVLLRADRPVPGARQLTIAQGSSGRQLLAVVPNGVIRAELAGSGQIGMMSATQRLFTLNEIRFELPAALLAGAPVFNLQGNLVGLLGAALESSKRDNEMAEIAADFAPKARTSLGAQPKFGPGEMTVAYSVTPDVLARVINGFLSPSRHVSHPVIGILISDYEQGGVLIEAVQKGSPAEAAGFERGDVIVSIDAVPIGNKVAYGREMARKRIGTKLSIGVQRNGRARNLQVTVGG